MKKTELYEKLASRTGSTLKDAKQAVDGVFGLISEALVEGEKVTITGFGNFEVKERAAKTGRNPQTGEPLQIPASKTVKFAVGKVLKDSVQE